MRGMDVMTDEIDCSELTLTPRAKIEQWTPNLDFLKIWEAIFNANSPEQYRINLFYPEEEKEE